MPRRQSQTGDDPVLHMLEKMVDTLTRKQIETLYDYVDEALWDKQFERFPAALVEMENKIVAADNAGLTSELDLDR